MKKIIVDKCINFVKTYNPQFDEDKISEIKYGIEGLYLTMSKLVIILFLSVLLNILKEVLIFVFLYNFIRIPSFGLHATKSWICLLSSIVIFILIPLICINITIPLLLKVIIGIITTLLMYKNAPADTHKRPILNPRRREVYKFIATIVSIIFVFTSIFIDNIFVSNSMIIVLIVQNIVIAPLTYKIFNQPYNNYKTYLKEMDLNM